MPEDLSLRLRDAFLALDDAPRARVVTAIHPADEMLQHIRATVARPEADLLAYFHTGRQAVRCAEQVLARCGRRLADCRRILDFACGAGRITRWFAALAGRDRVVASDLDASALTFVEREIGVPTARSDLVPERVALPGQHDLIFVGSLFTHLPRRTFARWLRVLYDALADDGLLLFSTHGTTVGGAAHREQPFAFYPRSETQRLDPDDYGSTYVTPTAVRELASEAGIEHLHSMERELWHIQDLHVVSRTPMPRLRGYRNTEQVHVGIHTVRFPSADHVWIGGWAKSARVHPPPRDVRLFVDGTDVAGTNLAAAVATDHHDWLRTDWYTEGDARPLPATGAVVAAVAEAHDGATTVGDAWWVQPPA